MIRGHVISAIFWRNVKQYFSGVLGYLIIVAFVFASAVLTFSPLFFARNLANLDQLTEYFPMLLLFLAPAISMAAWAEERRQGTDAILFTLPASDLEILLGKYFAVAAVYSVALLFSTTQLIALQSLGQPDWGVVFSTYVGYWLAGLALIAVGMFASSLTDSPTVAFVLGALMCAPFVVLGGYFRGFVAWERLGFQWNLYDFSNGLITWSQVFYFVSVIAFFLYLNLVVITRRHWSRGQQISLAGQFVIRIVCLALILLSANYVLSSVASHRFGKIDLTQEKLFSLSPTTLTVLERAKELKQPITVQAFVSNDVPRDFTNVRKQFLGMLRQLDSSGSNFVEVQIVDVVPNSEEELEAQRMGIEPKVDRSEVGGRTIEQNVVLGAHISSAAGDVTLDQIDNQTALEYELARGIAATTDKKGQISLGILETDTFFGGPEIDGRRIPWAYANSLKNLESTFKVTHIRQDDLALFVGPDPALAAAAAAENKPVDTKPAKAAPGVLLVPDPSSLNSTAADALVAYIRAGHPVILLADPLPFYWTYQHPTNVAVLNAPKMPRVTAQNPYSQVLASTFEPKADEGSAARVMQAIGVSWDHGQVAWNQMNPHPDFPGKWPDYLGNGWPQYYGPLEVALNFVKSAGRDKLFSETSPIVQGLNEMLFFYPGSIKPMEKADDEAIKQLEFIPLISLGKQSGVIPWEQITFTPKQAQRRVNPTTRRTEVEDVAARSQITMEDLIVVRPDPAHMLDDAEHIVAAHIRTKATAPKPDAESPAGPSGINVIVVADLDFVSDLYVEQQTAIGQPLDNLKFLQNAIENLAGETGFAQLRNRRPKPRTLTSVEQRIDAFRQDRAKKQAAIETRIKQQLEEEQKKLNEATAKIQEDESLSFLQKLQQSSQEASDAQARFDRQQEKLSKELKREIDAAKAIEQRQISSLESSIRYLAIFLAPLPAVLLGISVLTIRKMNENRMIRPDRKVH